MKNLYVLLVALLISFTINAQIINFPDTNFKNALVNTDCVDTDNDEVFDSDADTNNDGEIEVSEAEAVTNLYLNSLSISSLNGIENFVNLEYLSCNSNEISNLNLSLNQLKILNCSSNSLTSLDVSNLPGLEELNCDFNQITSLEILDAPNLVNLYCIDNQIETLTLGDLPSLNILDCTTNQISSFEYNSLPNLSRFLIGYNSLTSLDVNNLPSLVRLYCRNNQLTSLEIIDAPNLELLRCYSNQIETLTIGNSPLLAALSCYDNQLTSLDLSGTPSLTFLSCEENQLTTLDLSNNTVPFSSIYANDNQLTTLILKNGISDVTISEPIDLYSYNFNNNPNLFYICADEYEFNSVELILENSGITFYTLNSYCSFVPGNDYFIIEGNTRIDSDVNGCDINDAVFTNLNFAITNGTETRNFVSNTTGDYSIPVEADTYTITPILENPEYFMVMPLNIAVSFPSDASPHQQDFCITPNGEHNDLEITIIPLEDARPGFDTDYKLVYKNKGTTTLSGYLEFIFSDIINVSSFINAAPSEDGNLGGILTWDFIDLAPFESREIDITMNLNPPTDPDFPLNDGDLLSFNAQIFPVNNDSTPTDNASSLRQPVVNSFDPNDKTCLEGDFISPEMIGEYVHYMIRFENTGSASAVNIVVKDIIDTNKYDLASLIPLHASHNFVARINNDANYIEFIFENINLPFDDSNNDGFIAFKIKTLETLVLGDTFENNAEIYFDFNFPIITNIAQTTIATLSIEEFELANNNITLYPNPTTNVLHLESKQAIKQISIYDISGRRIKEIALIGSKTYVNFSTEDLSSGTYFVKIKMIQGEVVRKVIKD
ncbi:DUF7619 domain-containing protein [Psychroserpens jangbogonensis]|uniref:T9SS type A sorting domain-containing protein n=1 Tax=Psychroserpens jangbogonensis TaxID=1484460 RepID=UPI00053E55D2|nr:leucine-rich repeat domain-containing protein [Psychroserpens jangbogonensis]